MLARSPRRKLKEVALNDGFVPLSTIALRAVVEGKTTNAALPPAPACRENRCRGRYRSLALDASGA
jgi:hypothetical protein